MSSEKKIEVKEAYRDTKIENGFFWFSLPFTLWLPASLFFPHFPLYYLIKYFTLSPFFT